MANGLAASVIPSLTMAAATKNKKEIHGKIEQTIKLTMLIAIPCFIGFIVLAKPLMILLYNDANTTPALTLALGAVTVVLYSLSTVTNSILQGLDKMAEPAKNAGLSLIVHLAALFLMLIVFKWNIYALVGSNIIFSLCMCYLNIRAIRLTCGYRQEIDKTYLKPLTAALVMGIVTYVVHLLFDVLIGGRFVATGLSILIAMPVYAVVVLKLGTLSKKDFTALPKGDAIYRICKKLHLLPGH